MIDKEHFLKAYRVIIVLLTITILGCTSAKYPEVPLEQRNEITSKYEYVIGPGDKLKIYVWGHSNLSDSVEVRPDGLITTKLVEDLVANGKSPTDLAREIEIAYKFFVNSPVVTVSIDQFSGSRSQQVKVVGASAEARTLPFVQGMSLLDLIIEVGGLSEFASGNRAVLIRDGGESSEKYTLRIDDLVRKGDISANLVLMPGDIVLIPESRF